MALKNVKGTIIVTDQKNEKHTINADDLHFEEVERHERDLGPEIRYLAEADYGDWSLIAEVWEYPQSDKSHQDIIIEGAKYEGDFNYEFEA